MLVPVVAATPASSFPNDSSQCNSALPIQGVSDLTAHKSTSLPSTSPPQSHSKSLSFSNPNNNSLGRNNASSHDPAHSRSRPVPSRTYGEHYDDARFAVPNDSKDEGTDTEQLLATLLARSAHPEALERIISREYNLKTDRNLPSNQGSRTPHGVGRGHDPSRAVSLPDGNRNRGQRLNGFARRSSAQYSSQQERYRMLQRSMSGDRQYELSLDDIHPPPEAEDIPTPPGPAPPAQRSLVRLQLLGVLWSCW